MKQLCQNEYPLRQVVELCNLEVTIKDVLVVESSVVTPLLKK